MQPINFSDRVDDSENHWNVWSFIKSSTAIHLQIKSDSSTIRKLLDNKRRDWREVEILKETDDWNWIDDERRYCMPRCESHFMRKIFHHRSRRRNSDENCLREIARGKLKSFRFFKFAIQTLNEISVLDNHAHLLSWRESRTTSYSCNLPDNWDKMFGKLV